MHDIQFMELWLQNDGFLHRLAQLSQEKYTFDQSTIDTLRKDLRAQKAIDMVQSAFLGYLELTVWQDFDPKGGESIGALQRRLAQDHFPTIVLDDDDVGSYFLDVVKRQSDTTSYSLLYSEVLAAMVYESFQRTDLRDREEVTRLGRGIRKFFQRYSQLSKEDFEALCGCQVSIDPFIRVFKF